MTYPRYVMTEMGLRREDSPIDGRYINGALALVYDREDGTLLKHGDEHKLQAYFTTFRERTIGTPLAGAVALLSFEQETLSEELLEEINRCVHIAGYMERFTAKLSAIPTPSDAIENARPSGDLSEAVGVVEGSRVGSHYLAVAVAQPRREQVMPRVNGVPFRCPCGCNVFTKEREHRYSCNACGEWYASD